MTIIGLGVGIQYQQVLEAPGAPVAPSPDPWWNPEEDGAWWNPETGNAWNNPEL